MDIEKERAAVAELIPEAIAIIAQVMRRPGRNAVAQLNAAKIILDRGGFPAIQDVSIHDPAGSGMSVTLHVHQAGHQPRAQNPLGKVC